MSQGVIHYMNKDGVVQKKLALAEIGDFLAPEDDFDISDVDSLQEAIQIITDWTKRGIHSVIGVSVKSEELILEQVTQEYPIGAKIYNLQ